MHHDPYVVRRSGFFSSLVKGVFGTICVVLVCATTVALYGINVFDRKSSMILTPTLETARDLLSNWRTNLPPALADAVSDRRDPDYRSELAVSASVNENDEEPRIVISLQNKGKQTVSTIAARLIGRDADNHALFTRHLYLATPMTLTDSEWPGPLLPAADRTLVRYAWHSKEQVTKIDVEITDVRVWDPAIAAALPEKVQPLEKP